MKSFIKSICDWLNYWWNGPSDCDVGDGPGFSIPGENGKNETYTDYRNYYR